MERLAPEILRAYADALENPRRLGNIEACRRVPDFDQHMLLALNNTVEGDFPDEKVMELLRERLISVTLADPEQESTVLGIFYTNADPFFKKRNRLAAGIFPLYGEIERYSLKPKLRSDLGSWQSHGWVAVEDVSATQNDPFLVDCFQDGVDLIFFNSSPEDPRYQSVTPTVGFPKPMLHEQALERVVIERAIQYTDKWEKPYLFLQDGFREFIKAHKLDPRYSGLYEGWRKHVFPNTGDVTNNI